MAKMVLPRVHGLILCDEIEPSLTEADVFNLHGVRAHIVAPSFPYTHELLCVYLLMTGHDGTATGGVIVSDPETDIEIYASQQEEVSFTGPLFYVHQSFRLYDCEFQAPGVYYVQVVFDGKLVGERALYLSQGEAGMSNGRQIR